MSSAGLLHVALAVALSLAGCAARGRHCGRADGCNAADDAVRRCVEEGTELKRYSTGPVIGPVIYPSPIGIASSVIVDLAWAGGEKLVRAATKRPKEELFRECMRWNHFYWDGSAWRNAEGVRAAGPDWGRGLAVEPVPEPVAVAEPPPVDEPPGPTNPDGSCRWGKDAHGACLRVEPVLYPPGYADQLR
jgi:hypothetical protein